MTDPPSPPERWWCSSCAAENNAGDRVCRWCGREYAGPLHTGEDGAVDDLWSATRPPEPEDRWLPPPEPPPPATFFATPPAWGPPTVYDGGADGGDEDDHRPFPWMVLAAALLLVAVAAGVVAALAASDDPDTAAGTTGAGTTAVSAPATAAGSTVSPVTDVTSVTSGRTVTVTDVSLPVTDPTQQTDPTTSPPSTTRLSRNERAARRLEQYLAGDAATVSSLQGSWVVQLSAKRPGIEADGITYTMPDVLDNHEQLRNAYGAVLLWSTDWAYESTDLYITIIPTPYGDAETALDECRRLGFDRENCLAKKITTDRSDPETVEYLP